MNQTTKALYLAYQQFIRLFHPVSSLAFTCIAILFVVCNVFAQPNQFGFGLDYGVQPKFGVPQTYQVRAYVESGAKNGTIDVLLPAGIRLVQGALHYNFEVVKGKEQYFKFQLIVDTPGVYEVEATFNVTGLVDSRYLYYFPTKRVLYVYARTDTLYTTANKQEMERLIRDSLFVPQSVITERFKDVIDRRQTPERKRNAFSEPCTVVVKDVVRGYDGTRKMSIQQKRFAREHSLMMFEPQTTFEYKRNIIDTITTVTMTEDLRSRVDLILDPYLKKLYKLDQKIIFEPDSIKKYRLLDDRIKLKEKMVLDLNRELHR